MQHTEVYTILYTMMEQGTYTRVTARDAISKVFAYQSITGDEYTELMEKANTLAANTVDGDTLARIVALETSLTELQKQVSAIKDAVEKGSTTVTDPVAEQTGEEMNPIDAVAGMSYEKDKYYRDPVNGEVYICTVDVAYAGLPHEAVNVYFNWVRKE